MNVARTHPSVDESKIVSRLKCSSNLRDTIGDPISSEILTITQERSKRGREYRFSNDEGTHVIVQASVQQSRDAALTSLCETAEPTQ